MQISARNTLSGTVKSITLGNVNAEIVLELPGGVELTSTITRHSAERMGLRGRPACLRDRQVQRRDDRGGVTCATS